MILGRGQVRHHGQQTGNGFFGRHFDAKVNRTPIGAALKARTRHEQMQGRIAKVIAAFQGFGRQQEQILDDGKVHATRVDTTTVGGTFRLLSISIVAIEIGAREMERRVSGTVLREEKVLTKFHGNAFQQHQGEFTVRSSLPTRGMQNGFVVFVGMTQEPFEICGSRKRKVQVLQLVKEWQPIALLEKRREFR